jgi:hypothetical protein
VDAVKPPGFVQLRPGVRIVDPQVAGASRGRGEAAEELAHRGTKTPIGKYDAGVHHQRLTTRAVSQGSARDRPGRQGDRRGASRIPDNDEDFQALTRAVLEDGKKHRLA